MQGIRILAAHAAITLALLGGTARAAAVADDSVADQRRWVSQSIAEQGNAALREIDAQLRASIRSHRPLPASVAVTDGPGPGLGDKRSLAAR